MLYGFLRADAGVIRFDGVDTARDELLERFALMPYADTKPETLSGGFRRRLKNPFGGA
jgi:ABC-type multidrug transport system ATPase subunit